MTPPFWSWLWSWLWRREFVDVLDEQMWFFAMIYLTVALGAIGVMLGVVLWRWLGLS